MHARLPLMAILALLTANLSAVDEVRVLDNFDSYPEAAMRRTNVRMFAGGFGWKRDPPLRYVGWCCYGPGPSIAAGDISAAVPNAAAKRHLEASNAGVMRGFANTYSVTDPTNAIWIAFTTQGWGFFGSGGSSSISFLSAFPSEDAVCTLQAAGAPVKWTLYQLGQQSRAVPLTVDDEPHTMVLQLVASQASLWILPIQAPAAPGTPTVVLPLRTDQFGQSTVNGLFVQSSMYDGYQYGVVCLDNLRVGTSYRAVTANGGPTIATISPSSGPATGGTTLTITGTGFGAGTTVSIAGKAATSMVISSSTSLTAVTPAGTPGAADVVVTAANGLAMRASGAFTYTAATAAAVEVTTPAPAGEQPPGAEDSSGHRCGNGSLATGMSMLTLSALALHAGRRRRQDAANEYHH